MCFIGEVDVFASVRKHEEALWEWDRGGFGKSAEKCQLSQLLIAVQHNGEPVSTHTPTHIDWMLHRRCNLINAHRIIAVCLFSYKKYVFLDPLAGAVTKTHTTLETEKEDKPFDAPLSITKREQLERQVSCSVTPIIRQ